MKILLLITDLGVGGAERQVADLADAFARRGHEVVVVGLTEEAVVLPIDNSVRVVVLGARKRPLALWSAALQDFPVRDRLISSVGYHHDGVTGGAEGDDSYASFFLLAGKFSPFDAAIALAGDVDGKRGVLQPVADGISDHGIGNDLGRKRPVLAV